MTYYIDYCANIMVFTFQIKSQHKKETTLSKTGMLTKQPIFYGVCHIEFQGDNLFIATDRGR